MSFSNVGVPGRQSRAHVPFPFQGAPGAALQVDRTSARFVRSTGRGAVKREDYAVKIVAVLATVSVLALGGCAVSAQRAEEHAQDLAASQCAEQGKEFAQTGGTAASNGAVAAANARGQCVGPGDPGYVPPPPNP